MSLWEVFDFRDEKILPKGNTHISFCDLADSRSFCDIIVTHSLLVLSIPLADIIVRKTVPTSLALFFIPCKIKSISGDLPRKFMRKETNTMLFSPKEKGQGLVEYALILVLVAIVVIAALMILGPIIGNVFSKVNSSLSTV